MSSLSNSIISFINQTIWCSDSHLGSHPIVKLHGFLVFLLEFHALTSFLCTILSSSYCLNNQTKSYWLMGLSSFKAYSSLHQSFKTTDLGYQEVL